MQDSRHEKLRAGGRKNAGQLRKKHEITDSIITKSRETVRSIIADVLILDENEVGDDDHFVMDLGGDSLSVIGVITQLEEAYSLMIPDSVSAGRRQWTRSRSYL